MFWDVLWCHARNSLQFAIEALSMPVPPINDICDFADLGQRHRALQFRHLVVRCQKEWVADSLFTLKTLVYEKRCTVSQPIVICRNHPPRPARDVLEVVQRERADGTKGPR